MTYLVQQMDRLIELGVHELAGLDEDAFVDLADESCLADTGLLAIHPSLIPAARLAPLLTRAGKPGFVVPDMTDLKHFVPISEVEVPDSPFYVVRGIERGDDLRDRSPDEALPEILARGRTPLTIHEGISWLLQEPHQLVPNHCFMTIGSRKPKTKGVDKRTPALWISGGSDRDGGAAVDGAPKVGWCWAGNRHPWLGIASATERSPLRPLPDR